MTPSRTKVPVNPATLAEPAGYFDRAVRIGSWLFISGTSALTNLAGSVEERDRMLPESFEEQANATFDNIEKVLTSVGASFDDVYELHVMLSDRKYYGPLNAIFRERFPNRGFVGSGTVADLLAPRLKIEVAANAYLEERDHDHS